MRELDVYVKQVLGDLRDIGSLNQIDQVVVEPREQTPRIRYGMEILGR